MTQTEVEALLPAITPFVVPALMDVLYADALDQFTLAAPSCLGTSAENMAITYYIAGLLSGGAGGVGVKSEKIDDYAIAFGEGGQAGAYEIKYQHIVDTCNYRALMAGIGSGFARVDTLDCLDLDGAGVCDDTSGDEFN